MFLPRGSVKCCSDQATGKIYAKVLGLPSGQVAWDVYLVFPPGARWESQAPKPTYWMHQLSYPSENYLSGEKLRGEVERTLKYSKAKESTRSAESRKQPRSMSAPGGSSMERSETGTDSVAAAELEHLFVLELQYKGPIDLAPSGRRLAGWSAAETARSLARSSQAGFAGRTTRRRHTTRSAL